MIIFGTRTMESNRETGSFHCPRCSMDRSYQRKSMNRWFTLYFIPVIPMGSDGEYILCTSCGGTFGVEVLSYDPSTAREEAAMAVRRLLVVVLVSAQKTGEENLASLRTILSDVLDADVPTADLRVEVQQAREAQASLSNFARTTTADFTDDGKVMMMQAAYQVLAPNGFLAEAENDILRELGRAMGFIDRDIEQFLAGDESET